MARSASFFPLHSLGSFGTLSLSLFGWRSQIQGRKFFGNAPFKVSSLLSRAEGEGRGGGGGGKNATKSSFSSPFFRKCLFAPHTQGGEEKGKGIGGE